MPTLRVGATMILQRLPISSAITSGQIASVPISTIYHDEESSINPFVDTGRFIRLIWRARNWR